MRTGSLISAMGRSRTDCGGDGMPCGEGGEGWVRDNIPMYDYSIGTSLARVYGCTIYFEGRRIGFVPHRTLVLTV